MLCFEVVIAHSDGAIRCFCRPFVHLVKHSRFIQKDHIQLPRCPFFITIFHCSIGSIHLFWNIVFNVEENVFVVNIYCRGLRLMQDGGDFVVGPWEFA